MSKKSISSFITFLFLIFLIDNIYAQSKSEDSCSTPPQNCVDCNLTMTCIGVDEFGIAVQYEAKNVDGSIITQIPTTMCNQEGYWSCPDSPKYTPPLFVEFPKGCTSESTSLKRTAPMYSPLYLFVKDSKSFNKLALAACKRSAPENIKYPVYDFGVKSSYDLADMDFSYHSVRSVGHASKNEFPINRMIAFGDSITMNNQNRTSSMMGEFFMDMVSNGPVWVEHIARKSVKIKKPIELIDIATAGAALTPSLGDMDFGIMNQIDYALEITNQDNNSNEYANTIFMLMAGMIDTRDFIGDIWFQSGREGYDYYKGRLKKCIDSDDVYKIDPVKLGEICATKILLNDDASTRAAAEKLISHGAKYLMLAELPNFLLLPRYNSLQPDPPFDEPAPQFPENGKQFLSSYIKTFNEKLDVLINDLEKKSTVKIVKLDLYSIYNKLSNINDPMTKQARIKNTRYAGIYALIVPVSGGDPSETPRNYKPEESLFWDDAHPTETASCVIGERTLELMFQKFTKNNYKPNYKSCYHSYLQFNLEEPEAKIKQEVEQILRRHK